MFKKRVLESTEVDLLGSYYKQDGIHSAVGGGTGMEELTDAAADIIIAIPLNDDDVLTFDAGFSAYTSASSGNINPFFTDGTYTNTNNTGASSRYAAKNSCAVMTIMMMMTTVNMAKPLLPLMETGVYYLGAGYR